MEKTCFSPSPVNRKADKNWRMIISTDPSIYKDGTFDELGERERSNSNRGLEGTSRYPPTHRLHPPISPSSSNMLLSAPFVCFSHLVLLCLIRFLLLSNTPSMASDDMVEFLFQHQQICGNPFSDAQWVPVLDLCELECDAAREVCVENDEMKQRCNKLPDPCIRALMAERSANLRSSSVTVTHRSLLSPNQTVTSAEKTALLLESGRRSKKQSRRGQQQQKNMEMRNAVGRRRAPARIISPKQPLGSTLPRTTFPMMKEAAKEKEKGNNNNKNGTEKAKWQLEGNKKKGDDRWTFIPVRRMEETKERKWGRNNRGPHIIQSVIELLRQE